MHGDDVHEALYQYCEIRCSWIRVWPISEHIGILKQIQ